MINIQFLGGAETVTGSKYLLTFRNKKILIDCGLFQGLKNLRLKNWDPFPIPAHTIDAILLTHAHLDHSGYIPRLIREGFKGNIYATSATKKLCEILLSDSGYLMEEEARFLNKKKISKHSPALPFYTQEEGQKSIKFFSDVELNKRTQIDSDISFEFRYAGHILGAASILVKIADQTIYFSGDLGRPEDPIFFPAEAPAAVDYLILESTYGNKAHKNIDVLEDLASHIQRAVQKDGVILVPAFAVGRTQLLIYYLSILKMQKRIPDIPIYLNSPMATDATKLFCENTNLHKISKETCNDFFNPIHYVQSVEESKALNEKKGPMIIISASGMLTGGRILHHMKAFASNPKNMILLTGFQAAGTRGQALRDGAKEVKIHGQYIPINAEIVNLDYLSAHADYTEIIQWLKTAPHLKPKKVFVTHGESPASDELRRRLVETFHWDCLVPTLFSEFQLG